MKNAALSLLLFSPICRGMQKGAQPEFPLNASIYTSKSIIMAHALSEQTLNKVFKSKKLLPEDQKKELLAIYKELEEKYK